MNQPVQLAGRRRAGVLSSMSSGLTPPSPPRISIKAQKFTLIDGAGVQIPVQMFDPNYGLYLDVVIIGANPTKSKIFYQYDYDPANDDPPTCFSDNGIGPSAQSSVPQSPTCAQCPNNVWGSSTSNMTGKPTKACSDRKKLAVLVVNDPAKLVYQLQIPPASLKNLAVLIDALSSHQVTDSEGQRPADPADVVTRIYFNPKKQGELLFQPMGFHQQLAPYIDPLIELVDSTGAIKSATGENDVPYAGAVQIPQGAPMAQLAAPQPMPQMQAPPPAAPQFAPQPAPGPAFGSPAPAQQFTPPAAGQANGANPPAPPAPRTRRGGARNGAGRPAQAAAPQAAPTHAPFQQAPQNLHQQQGDPIAPMAAPQPMQAGTGQPGPVAFSPQPAPAFAGPVPTNAMPAGAPSMPEMPGFLQRAPQPAPASGGAPAFGMTNGAAPDAALAASLDAAFGAPLQPRQR
jgi:hypothetical protein